MPSVSLAYMGVVMEDRSLHWERTVVNSGAWRVSGVAGVTVTVTAVAAKGWFVWVMALNWEMRRSFVVEVVIVAVVSARASTVGII